MSKPPPFSPAIASPAPSSPWPEHFATKKDLCAAIGISMPYLNDLLGRLKIKPDERYGATCLYKPQVEKQIRDYRNRPPDAKGKPGRRASLTRPQIIFRALAAGAPWAEGARAEAHGRYEHQFDILCRRKKIRPITRKKRGEGYAEADAKVLIDLLTKETRE